LQELLDESNSKKPNRVEAARAGVRALREKLQAQGINVGDEMDELSDKLLEAFSDSKIEDYLQKILAKLRDLADQIEQSPDAVGQKSDETIKSLNKDLFVDQEKRLEEKRKQQYRKSAQDAIAESFSSLGLPSFAGGDLKLENSQQEEHEQK
jgi:DNA-binding ferritin-like protein